MICFSQRTLQWFKGLPLQEKERRFIFPENARRLLGL